MQTNGAILLLEDQNMRFPGREEGVKNLQTLASVLYGWFISLSPLSNLDSQILVWVYDPTKLNTFVCPVMGTLYFR